MSLIVRLWDSDGKEILSRAKLPQNIAVSAYVTTVGIPDPGVRFRFTIAETGFFSESVGYPTATAIIRGLPDNRSLTLKVLANNPVSPDESATIPISTGKGKISPIPEELSLWESILKQVKAWGWWTLGGLVLLGSLWVFLNSRYVNK
jgi:hypothetical protein